VTSKVCQYATNEKKGLSRHEGGLFERCPIYATKKPSPKQKIRQREARMGSYLSRSKFAFKKVEDQPHENHIGFKSCTFQKDIKVCPHHTICYSHQSLHL
jgi:hypothetical protein